MIKFYEICYDMMVLIIYVKVWGSCMKNMKYYFISIINNWIWNYVWLDRKKRWLKFNYVGYIVIF